MSCSPNNFATGGKWLLTSTDTDLKLWTQYVSGFAMPGIDIGFIDGPKGGSANPLSIMGDTVNYDVVPFTFNVDGTFSNYRTLFQKIKNLANEGWPTPEDLNVELLDNMGKPTGVRAELRHAYPFQLSGFQLISTEEGDKILVCTVTFKVQDVEFVTDGD